MEDLGKATLLFLLEKHFVVIVVEYLLAGIQYSFVEPFTENGPAVYQDKLPLYFPVMSALSLCGMSLQVW